jgi:hypothetical protein
MSLILNGTTGLSDVDGSAATPAIRGTDANTGMFFPAADTIAFAEGGVEVMRIDSSGNVGIGQTPTAYGATVRNVEAYIAGASGFTLVTANTASVKNEIASSESSLLGQVGTRTNHPVAFKTNDTERMRIDSSGNVGIGTSSPSSPFQVHRDSVSFVNIKVSNSVTGSGSLDGVDLVCGTSGEAYLYNRENQPLIFGTNNTERARISSAGVISIGTTGTNGGGKFYCYDDTTTGAFIGGFRAANASYASADQVNWVDRSASSAYSFFVARSNSDTNTSFTLRGDGNAYADGTWNNNGADYAEYFESATGAAIPVGTTVVLDGNKVRASTDQDAASLIIGVVRPKEPSIASMVVGNTAWNKWQGMFLTDDFGRYILEPHEVVEWSEVNGEDKTEFKSYESHMIPSGVVVPENATRKSLDEKGNPFTHYKLNPDYDASHAYVPREERPEWLIIGLIGQVPVLAGQPIGDRWIKMRDVSASVAEYMIR